MKRETIKKLLAIAGCVTILCAVDVSISAAVTATASASGDIVAAIQITKGNDLQFGKIAAGTIATDIILDPTAETTAKGATGDAQVMTGGTVTAASFSIVGDGSNAFTVALPTGTFNVTSGSDTMAVKTFTSDKDGTGLTNFTGTVAIKVGATLVVGPNQPAGHYTANNALQITVTYN